MFALCELVRVMEINFENFHLASILSTNAINFYLNSLQHLMRLHLNIFSLPFNSFTRPGLFKDKQKSPFKIHNQVEWLRDDWLKNSNVCKSEINLWCELSC